MGDASIATKQFLYIMTDIEEKGINKIGVNTLQIIIDGTLQELGIRGGEGEQYVEINEGLVPVSWGHKRPHLEINGDDYTLDEKGRLYRPNQQRPYIIREGVPVPVDRQGRRIGIPGPGSNDEEWDRDDRPIDPEKYPEYYGDSMEELPEYEPADPAYDPEEYDPYREESRSYFYESKGEENWYRWLPLLLRPSNGPHDPTGRSSRLDRHLHQKHRASGSEEPRTLHFSPASVAAGMLCITGLTWAVLNDVTGIGVADDLLIPALASGAMLAFGIGSQADHNLFVFKNRATV